MKIINQKTITFKRMKKHVITAFFALLATVVSAQSNFGKDYFGIGEYTKAKEYFESQLATAPAESNYYLGEIARAEGKTDAAMAYYDKGIAADALYPLNFIGKGSIILKTNQKEAELIFSTTLKKNKKNAEVNVAIARAYYQAGLRALVPIKLEIARKVAKKSPLLYIFEGDMLVAEEKNGEAAGKYEQAIYFDPTNTVAALKYAEVYALINEEAAIAKVTPVIAAHPDYTVAYRTLGRVYNSVGKYKSAIESFVKYYGDGQCDSEDLPRLASAYYFTDQFAQSVVLLDQALAKDSMNFVLNRLRMYNAAKTKDPLGVSIATRFFSIQGSTFIDKDYAAYATILADAGKFPEALEQYNKVLASSAAKPETYKELATLYSQMKDHAKAAETTQKYIDMVGGIDVAEGADYYSMGRSWYLAAQSIAKDSTDAGKLLYKDYLVKADTAFGTVCIKSPESHIGNLWRGNANAALDPETTLGLAKPFYEKSLALLQKKLDNGTAMTNSMRKDMITIYRYLAWFYYVKLDKDNAILYCNKILELAPDNVDAKSLIESYNPPAPKVVTKKVKKSAATGAVVAPTAPVAPVAPTAQGPKSK
jgi:tetratricopeptide (TPR) repeat protein